MEIVLTEHGNLSDGQAMLVVSMAKASCMMFGVTADFAITQDFTDSTSYDDRLALAQCLFAVSE